MSNTKNKDKLEKYLKKKNKIGFTLVELIVVITILAILGTIAFISFQNYTKNSRDGVRIADINSIKKTLELFITDKGFYPLPDNGTPIVWDGATAWVQGKIGDNVIINLGRLNKKPVDPLTNSEYTYSITNTKTEYQLGAILEGEGVLSYNVPLLLNKADAATTKTAIAMVTGSYNEKLLKISTGGIDYILAVPSIIGADLTDSNLQSIIDNRNLVYNNYQNLPDSYKDTGYTMTGGFDFQPPSNDIVIYSGSLATLSSSGTIQQQFVTKLQSVYDGTIIQSEPSIKEILIAQEPVQQQALVGNYITNKVGGLSGVNTATIQIANSCATQPSYTGATFTKGTPSLVNQTWQGTDDTLPCYYTCGEGKALLGAECVANSCETQPDYSNTTYTIGNPTTPNQARQNTTSGNPCYYSCDWQYVAPSCNTGFVYDNSLKQCIKYDTVSVINPTECKVYIRTYPYGNAPNDLVTTPGGTVSSQVKTGISHGVRRYATYYIVFDNSCTITSYGPFMALSILPGNSSIIPGNSDVVTNNSTYTCPNGYTLDSGICKGNNPTLEAVTCSNGTFDSSLDQCKYKPCQ